MRVLLRIFGILLLLGGIIGTTFFSYFAFVEGNRVKQGLAKQREDNVKDPAPEQQKIANAKKADANFNAGEYYLDLENSEKKRKAQQESLNLEARSVKFYERQALYAFGSGIIVAVGFVILILSFIGRGKPQPNNSMGT